MICYVWVNKYCKGIQAGIQAAHAIAELSKETEEFDGYLTWAKTHKTIVVLDGGDHQNLNGIASQLRNFGGVWEEQVGVFREEGLNDAVTAVAYIALDDEVKCAQAVRKHHQQPKSSYETLQRMLESRTVNGSFQIGEYISQFSSHRG